MKAIICTKYGSPDVFNSRRWQNPLRKDDEVLIKIHAASINSRDWRMHESKSVLYPPDAGRLSATQKQDTRG